VRTVRFADKRYSAYCFGGEKFGPSPSANSPGGIAEDEALGEGLANHIRRFPNICLPTGRLIVVFSHTGVKAALPLTQSLCKPTSQCVSTKKCNIQGKNAAFPAEIRSLRGGLGIRLGGAPTGCGLEQAQELCLNLQGNPSMALTGEAVNAFCATKHRRLCYAGRPSGLRWELI
jgi:hypothetical protein